jgi:hypothetical protein
VFHAICPEDELLERLKVRRPQHTTEARNFAQRIGLMPPTIRRGSSPITSLTQEFEGF